MQSGVMVGRLVTNVAPLAAPAAFRRRSAAPNGRAGPRARFARAVPTIAAGRGPRRRATAAVGTRGLQPAMAVVAISVDRGWRESCGRRRRISQCTDDTLRRVWDGFLEPKRGNKKGLKPAKCKMPVRSERNLNTQLPSLTPTTGRLEILLHRVRPIHGGLLPFVLPTL